MSGELTTPDGCRWCGDERHHHGSQWMRGVGLHQWVPPTAEQRLQRMVARRVAAGRPLHRRGETVTDHLGRSWLILAVGAQAYFVRRLDWRPGDLEPRETAWAFTGLDQAAAAARGEQR